MPAPRPTIWIVDDSPTEALITERSLGTSFDFEKFADGSLVVERIASAPELPDVLLLDWVMPGMTGDEVCRYLRANPHTMDLPVILVTASRVETSDVVAGLASGANDYVARPFAPEELRARVDAALRAKSLREIASKERRRLDTVNRFGHALLQTRTDVREVLDRLAIALTHSLCDGCSVLLLPGAQPVVTAARHRADPTAEALSLISSLADPAILAFDSTAHARAQLPPAYHAYIDRFGLRGIAILPFPTGDPIAGVVTVTRDGNSSPFEPDDIATIETCIEYAALAMQTALRFDAERTAFAQLHAVLEHLPIGLVATDATGAVTLVNAIALQLVPGIGAATTLTEVAALAHWRALDQSATESGEWLTVHAQHSNNATRGEWTMTPHGREPRTIVLSSVPLRDSLGAPAGSVTALEDVTADRALTSERENTANFQAQMVGIVGHDLRNPLNAVMMGIALLEDLSVTTPAVLPVVKRLDSSTRRMTRIVEQLLDVTRARLGGGIPMEPRMVELSAIVRATIDELALATPKSRLEIAETVVVTGFWDPDRLAQVVSNLASNAVQYGAPGSPVVISLTRDDTHVRIAVSNRNRDRPIAPELLARLFDPYRRGRDEHAQSGLGLGLYIVHEIVQAHRGKIEVESSDPFTRFTVTLPIERS